MWKCIFDSVTNRGVGFNRPAGEGEYEIMIHPSESGWFNAYPERYQYTNGKLEPFDPAVLEAERIAKIKLEMWEKIKEERQKRYDGGVLVDGIWFDSDLYTKIKFIGVKDEIDNTSGTDTDLIIIDGEPLTWKTMDNSFVPMTRKLAKDITKAQKILEKRVFKAAEVHRVTMEASADPENYNYLTGWPQRYEG